VRIFEVVAGEICGPLVEEITGMLIKFVIMTFIIYIVNQMWSNQREFYGLGNVTCKGYVRNSHSILVRKPKGETGCSTWGQYTY